MKFSLLVTLCALWVTTAVTAQELPPTATAVFQDAYQQAAKEHKNVFIIFHASWCGWCHRMDSAMDNPACRKFFNDHYVIRHLTVMEAKDKTILENPGALDLMKKFNGDKGGIPFWLIFDAKGELLADSQIRPDGVGLDAPGKNVGCPSEKEEVAYFIKVLKNTSPLTEESQVAAIQKVFSHTGDTGH